MSQEHLCSICAVPLVLEETIEGDADAVERLVCPLCGNEAYLGRFRYLPLVRQFADDSSQAKLFHCANCNIRTAGIVLNVRSECRWCPACQTPLFQYPGCCKEGLERKGELCPTCKALQVVKVSKPSVDQRTAHTPRGGAWS